MGRHGCYAWVMHSRLHDSLLQSTSAFSTLPGVTWSIAETLSPVTVKARDSRPADRRLL
jgi:hypothetical protein